MPARGDFFALMQTGYRYRQEASLFFKSTGAEEPAPKEEEEIQSAAWAANILPSCLPHGSWEEGGGSGTGAGLLAQDRLGVGEVGSHWGQG